MASDIPTLTCLLHGPDRPGLVARVSGWIFENGGNIIHADQHRDAESGIFFQRVEWNHPTADYDQLISDFKIMAAELGMSWQIASSQNRPRILVFVSGLEHCFHDLILRWKAGEFHADIVGVVSNHDNLESATRQYGLPYYFFPLTKDTKREVEAKQVSLIRKLGIDLIVLARYMQILSAGFLDQLRIPIINIHHSFLPAFAGARPYHQAARRGVKIIGATAHYVTPVLDDGPIIQQEVTKVSHRNSVDDLVRKGRDLEKIVLAQAVRWHLENRILVYANKTVVFD